MAHRKERFSSTLKQCLADILVMEMDDPRLRTVFISDVIVSDDLRTARVFIAAAFFPVSGQEGAGPGPGTDELLGRLTKARGFIKHALARRMYLRYIPELIFLKDEPVGIKTDSETDRETRGPAKEL